MEKILIIDNKEVPFKSTGAFFLKYKAQFKKDGISELIKVSECIEKIGKSNTVDLDSDVLYNLIWTLAKTANPKIKPPMQWFDEFETFPIIEVVIELQDLLMSTIQSSVKAKN
ncbi:hypothetical protein [Clostridium cadaveris]|uniref:hypothetical protein n=1 Tax=Clostridium cadaveris TaxID=1529 RepID=UPI0015B729F0|nr:hypothetical protein [Clostridium cadaveris]NWK10404.1 hypothetical protein [Clostridium cadaveris]